MLQIAVVDDEKQEREHTIELLHHWRKEQARIRRPQFMFCISNPYDGEIHFDDDGNPVTLEKEHGFGIASINAYCEKYGAFCDYELENDWFVLRMVQP